MKLTDEHVKYVAGVVGAVLIGIYAAGFTYSDNSPVNKPAAKPEPWIVKHVQPGSPRTGKKLPATSHECLFVVTPASVAFNATNGEDYRISMQYVRGMLNYCEGVIIQRPDGVRYRWNEID